MKRKDFYLFRHGETEYNRLGLRQGQGIDAGLNETGRLQAQKLAVYLEEKEIEVIYTLLLCGGQGKRQRLRPYGSVLRLSVTNACWKAISVRRKGCPKRK